MRVYLVFVVVYMIALPLLPTRAVGQQITLNEKNIGIMQLLEKMEQQSGYTFFFNRKDIADIKPIQITVREVSIEEALQQIFEKQPCDFEIRHNVIILTKRKEEGHHADTEKADTDSKKDRLVSGVVIDSLGRPIPRASVLIKGTQTGAATDISGKFSLWVNSSDTLVFKMMGFESRNIEVGNRAFIDVALKWVHAGIEEVITIGYGKQLRRKVSAAIASVKEERIRSMGVTGIDKAIQGSVAGVMVTNNSGEPGGGVNIRIRGTASISSGNDPLYVIDGIPLENTQTSNVNVGQERVNGMSHIDPSDIETVEILKDAAAASIYGARAANGVILISTKRGKVGQGTLDVDYYTGLAKETRRYDLLGAADYARLVNEGREQLASALPQYSPYFSEEFIQQSAVNTDWQDEIFRFAPISQLATAFRGGSTTTRYMFSTGYLNQQGIVIDTDFKRFNMRANVDQDVNSRIAVGTSFYAAWVDQARAKNDGSPVSGSTENNNHLYGTPVLSTGLVKAPTTPVYLADGSFSNDPDQRDYGNPVRQAKEVAIGNQVVRVIGSIYARTTLFSGLSFKAQASGDLRSEFETWLDPPHSNPYPGVDFQGKSSQRTFRQQSWYLESYLDYRIGSAVNQADVIVGSTVQETVSRNSFIQVRDIGSADMHTLSGGGKVEIGTSGKQSYGIVSYFGRINYDYRSKYLLLVNMRYDGSSRFGKDNRYGFFPSASIGWRISEEAFMQNVRFLDEWKLRASYGLTGNQEIGNYATRGTMVIGGGTNRGNNYGNQTGGIIATLPSPEMKWEETAQVNLGMDFGLFGNRLNIVTDHYIKTTKGLLFAVPLPGSRGVENRLSNIGSMQNRGVELTVSATLLMKRQWRWASDLNISMNKNKVLELADGADVQHWNSIAREGNPISFILYEREKFVDPNTGFIRFVDRNGNGRRDEDDRILAGSPFPILFGGFANNLIFKNVDLSFFFQFAYGNKIYNQTRSWIERLDLLTVNPTSIIGPNASQEAYENRWRKPGDRSRYPGVNYRGDAPIFNLPHTGWLEDGSYLRLKTLTIGYSVAERWLSAWGLKAVRVYFTTNNLLTLTGYRGFDPEVNHFTEEGFAYGYDNGTYPQAMSYRIGINCKF